MKTTFFNLILLSLLTLPLQAQDTLHFGDWASLMHYAEEHTYTAALGKEQQHYAKMQRLAAIGNTVNPRIPIAFSITDNTDLPVSFIPASVFGGPDGVFREVTMGQEYISSFTITPQLDIFNPSAITKVKSAKINEQLTETNNQLTQKNILESVNACYHNILSLQQQQQFLSQNLAVADSILVLVKQRYEQGIARSQEINDATINKINIEDRIAQLGYSIEQQTLMIKALCDIPADKPLRIRPAKITADSLPIVSPTAGSQLAVRQARLQHSFAKAERQSAHWAHLPNISFVSSVSWQNNSNDHFFDANNKWINANYWGFRLNYNLPTDVQKLTNISNANSNLKIANIQMEHVQLQNDINNRQLENDYQKALAQIEKARQIVTLKRDTYQKGKNQYQADILPLDKLLLFYNDLLNSELNVLNAEIALQFANAKIELNNRY